MRNLSPRLKVVGSVAEGTRVLTGGDLDVSVDFEGWSDTNPPFRVNPSDPFHLYQNGLHCPKWMDAYFDKTGMGIRLAKPAAFISVCEHRSAILDYIYHYLEAIFKLQSMKCCPHNQGHSTLPRSTKPYFNMWSRRSGVS